ncbi:MAG: hypothetical protein V7K85_07955 [Nostoc sp.]
MYTPKEKQGEKILPCPYVACASLSGEVLNAGSRRLDFSACLSNLRHPLLNMK